MSDGDAVTKNARKRNKAKSPKEPADLENQENSTLQMNAQVLEKPIECPHCHRRFKKPCHLKLHSVIHKPGWEESSKKRSGGSKKEKSQKSKAEDGASGCDVTTASKKHRSRKTKKTRDSNRTEVAPTERAPISDVFNGETSSPAPAGLTTEEPPPLLWNAGYDERKSKTAATASKSRKSKRAAQAADAAIDSGLESPAVDFNESSSQDAIRVESSPEHAELVPEESDDEAGSLKWGRCSCELQLGVRCSLRFVEPLPTSSFPYVASADLFIEGTSRLLDEIECAENLTTCERAYLETLALITGVIIRCAAAFGNGGGEPSYDGDDSLLDHCEDVVPDDFYEVLAAVALQQQMLEGR